MDKFDFTLTVSPTYTGEYKDALGIAGALSRQGYSVHINPLSPLSNIRREVNLEFKTNININFHSSYRPSKEAQHNYLFYHEVHDKTCQFDVPFGIFSEYRGVFTPAKDFAEAMGIDSLCMATDYAMFHKVDPLPEYACDIVFVGSMHQFRDVESAKQYLLPLIAKYKVCIWGSGWDSSIFGDSVMGPIKMMDTKLVYSSAKVGLNFVSDAMVGWGLGTNRLYDMAACGLPVVSYKCDDYADAYGTAVLWANDPDTAHARVELLLSNDGLRGCLSERLIELTETRHTWDTRVNDMIKILQDPSKAHSVIPFPDTHITGDCDIRIAIPGALDKTYAQKLAWMMTWGQSRIRTKIELYRGSFRLDDVRNAICKSSYDQHTPWLLFIDDDTAPLSKNHLNYLVEGIQRGYKIISGWYVNEHPASGNDEPLIWVDDGFGGHVRLTTLPANRYIKASYVPGGFLCIAREVLHKFLTDGTPMFMDTSGKPDDHPEVLKWGKVPEDRFFSERAREFGYELIVDSRLECEHIKTVVKSGSKHIST